MPAINFFEEDISFNLPQKIRIRNWIKKVAQQEGAKVKELNFIFCSDQYLKQVNIDYLQHNYFTDIITFDNSENEKELEGDIFISIDRIQDNSQQLSVPFEQELRRVIIHGVLHLLAFEDKTEDEKQVMRNKEEESLYLYGTLNQS